MHKSLLIVLVGTSGSGKSTLMNAALSQISSLKRILNVTTRSPRFGEVDGIHKIFMEENEFKRLEDDHKLCIVNTVYGFNYAFQTDDFSSKQPLICDIYYKNLEEIKNHHKNIVSIYIKPLSIEHVIHAIKCRKNNVVENSERLRFLKAEYRELENLSQRQQFDYIFINEYNESSQKKFVDLINYIIKFKKER